MPMTDDLGLGLRNDDEPRAADPPNYTARRLGVAIATVGVIAVLVLVGLLVTRGLDGIRSFLGAPADYSGAGTSSVVVQVQQGDTLSRIGSTLHKAGVVKSAGAFTKVAADDARARTIGPGYYKLRHHMKASLALALLLDPRSLVASRVVVIEGMRMDAILATIAKDTHLSLDALKKAASNPAALGVPSWGRGHSLEGFLYPATYQFGPDVSATAALSAMVSRFNQEAATLNLVAQAQTHHRTPYDVLTLASIVQREGRLDSDFPRIAEVFDNRLARGMPLGSDATLYYIKPLGYGLLTSSDLRINSPYNTRLHTGLPPTPITSPGELALRAALDPATGPYLYFVTIDKAGHAAFATTLAEFNRLVAESRRNGVQ
jgi:UPF0755 protein